jgi:hypothetical protein
MTTLSQESASFEFSSDEISEEPGVLEATEQSGDCDCPQCMSRNQATAVNGTQKLDTGQAAMERAQITNMSVPPPYFPQPTSTPTTTNIPKSIPSSTYVPPRETTAPVATDDASIRKIIANAAFPFATTTVVDTNAEAMPGEKTGATQLINGAVNYSITTTVHQENIFNYGQFVNALNFGQVNNGLLGTEQCGPDVVLETDFAAMYLSEYISSGDAVNSQLLLQDAVKILDYDGEHQDVPYGQIDADGSGNIHGSLRFTGVVRMNNGRRVDSCFGKDLLYKTDSCKTVDWHLQFRNVVNETMNHKADSCGNVYVVGAYVGELYACGNGQAHTRLLTTRMKQNMFLAKVDCCGKVQWAVDADDRPNPEPCDNCSHSCNNTCGSSCNSRCTKCPPPQNSMDNYVDSVSLTLTNADEYPILTGSYTRHVTFGTETLTNKVARANAYVAEFDTNGCFAMMYGPDHCPRPTTATTCSDNHPSNHFLLGESIGVDANDVVHFTGSIKGRFAFSEVVEPGSVEASFNQGVYVTQIGRGSDVPTWTSLITATPPQANAFNPTISVHPDGTLHHAFQTQGSPSYISPSQVLQPLPGSGTNDLAVANLDSAGEWRWFHQEVGTVNNSSEHIASNSIFVHTAGSYIVNETQVDPFVSQNLR